MGPLANDGVLFPREARKSAHTAPGGRFHGVSATYGTFEARAEYQFGDGAARVDLLGAWRPVTDGDIFGGVHGQLRVES